VEFLSRSISEVPIGTDPHALTRIAECCARLPLALGLVAGHIRGTPGWTLTDHADRLEERRHNRLLEAGVELALNVSYNHLPASQQRLLRLTALHPGHDLDAYGAAALAGTDLPTARSLLQHLYRDNLLLKPTAGRYSLHDLVRAYATSRANDQDPPTRRRAALTRLFDYYLANASTAMNTMHPAETHYRPQIPAPATPTPALSNPRAARAWLDTECPTLVAVAAHTATCGWPTYTTQLSAILYRFLMGGNFTDAIAIHTHAYVAAQRAGNRAGQAHADLGLGGACARLGRSQQATKHLRRALRIFQQIDDPLGQARTLTNLGLVERLRCDYQAALGLRMQALHLFRRVGDQIGEAGSLVNIGIIECQLGLYEQAAEHIRLALILFQLTDDHHGQATALLNLGEAERSLGRYETAVNHYTHALTILQRLGSRSGEACILDELGKLQLHLGRTDHAAVYFRRALAIYRDIGERDGEIRALNGIGEAAHIDGNTADALACHSAAFTLAIKINASDLQARAHTGLGRAYHTLNDPDKARHHLQHALVIYTDLGFPGIDQIHAQLASLDQPTDAEPPGNTS
jgi:tetratricopeptide (TPR) repeat protein